MRRHNCPGDDCGYCQRRIAAAEDARDFPDPVSEREIQDLENAYEAGLDREWT